MKDIKDKAAKKHQRGIEDVNECLMALQISIASLYVFGHTIDRTNHDQNAGGVENVHITSPRDLSSPNGMGRCSKHATMKNDRDDNEESEENDLYKKTSDDHMLS
jgi:hypothetical protein